MQLARCFASLFASNVMEHATLATTASAHDVDIYDLRRHRIFLSVLCLCLILK